MFNGGNDLSNFCRGSPKEPSCKIISKSMRSLRRSSRLKPFSIFVSPAKQKRDICNAFPAASLAAAAKTFLCLGNFLGNYKG